VAAAEVRNDGGRLIDRANKMTDSEVLAYTDLLHLPRAMPTSVLRNAVCNISVLKHFSHRCTPYPEHRNQACALSGVICGSRSVMA
jgi:hypothetical protein